MLTHFANENFSGLSFWPRVREFAVPPSMIETATARRLVRDWAGACAAAGFDVDIDMRSVARRHGSELASRIRADLRSLAPDLLRWHMPRIAPDGLLRPGLTIALARYEAGIRCGSAGFLYLVVRTAPAWADAGQRISLALWDGSTAGQHPHPRPNRRFRLDLHRHLWDARRVGELRMRSGAESGSPPLDPELRTAVMELEHCAVGRWAAEGEILCQAEGRPTTTFVVRFGAKQRVVLDLAAAGADGTRTLRIASEYPIGGMSVLPVLPDAATYVLPDLALLRAGAITAERLHPLVASALVPGYSSADAPRAPDQTGQRIVECRGEQHRIGLVDGVLAALDHDPAEIRREELLAALSGTPLPCLQAIDTAHRQPDWLVGVRERLDHGDIAGALTIVEGLLGPEALLRDGALRDELEAAARRRITHGLFRAGLSEPGMGRVPPQSRRSRDRRAHPRNAASH